MAIKTREPIPSRFVPYKGEDSDKASSQHGDREVTKAFYFTGGIDRSMSPEMIPDSYCRSLMNMSYPQECAFPVTRGAMRTYHHDAVAHGRVTNVYVYAKDSSTSYVVFSAINDAGTDQNLYYLNTSTLHEVQIAATLGTTIPPTFHTFAGKLLVAASGQKLHEWAGNTGGGAAKATGTVTVATQPAADETVTIAARVYTFKATRAAVGQVTIGANVNATATNLAAAVNSDAWEVAAAVATNVVTITASRTGAAGNSYTLVDGTGGNLTVSAGTLASGADGLAYDAISTYGSPSPAIVTSDKNGRVICSGDVNEPDRVYFSAPQNAFHWASGSYGDGEYADIGYREGNKVTAVQPYLSEIVVHKAGQNQEIHRITVADSTAANWSITTEFYSGDTAAVNQRCALSTYGSHFALDSRLFRVYVAADTYDEIQSFGVGNRVADLLSGIAASTAFIVHDPLNSLALVFPNYGKSCVVYHYNSQRWSHYSFPHHTIGCGCYHAGLGAVLLGCDDGYIYKLDTDYGVDQQTVDPDVTYATGQIFEWNVQSEIIGKAVSSEMMAQLLVKQTILDYQSLVAGSGTIGAVLALNDSNVQTIDTFTINDEALFLYDATGDLADASMEFAVNVYGRKVSFKQAFGNVISPKIATSGGRYVFSRCAWRIAHNGRTPE